MTEDGFLASYFRRIGYAGPVAPTAAVLRALHALHPAAIPFEGLDPFLGRPVAIDASTIEEKLLHRRRGGYCHEQNALFQRVLAAVGFRVAALGARVVWMTPGRPAPLTHRLTLVELPEGPCLADVGFGGQTPTAPLVLEPELAQETPHGTFRVLREEASFAVELRLPGGWEPLYRFRLEPQSQADFEMANWFTATHPRTRFVRNLVAARIIGEERCSLLNAALTRRRPDGSAVAHQLRDAAELGAVLEEVMGLDLPLPAAEIWARLPMQPVPSWP